MHGVNRVLNFNSQPKELVPDSGSTEVASPMQHDDWSDFPVAKVAKRGEHTFRCTEPECGSRVAGTGINEIPMCVLAPSKLIGGSELGLYSKKRIRKKTVLGYFGGERVCVQCVRRRKLNLLQNHYSLVACDTTYNEDGEEVLWYLHRTGDRHTDGCMWYVNSVTRTDKQNLIVRNCCIECSGFDSANDPVVGVYTSCVDKDTELLLNYMLK